LIPQLKNRLLYISNKYHLPHIGSGISCIDTLFKIYSSKKEEDSVVLSMGHAAVALYCIIEYFYPTINAEELYLKHGVHPSRDIDNKIDCSTGSLGIGITIAAGMALANINNHVHCIISDGECAEGSVWESLRFIYEQNITNISIYVIVNGYAGIGAISVPYLINRLQSFLPGINIIRANSNFLPGVEGVLSHYYTLNDATYKIATENL
jgi:transketolase